LLDQGEVDAEWAQWLETGVERYKDVTKREWLEWSGGLLMPKLWETVRSEEEAAQEAERAREIEIRRAAAAARQLEEDMARILAEAEREEKEADVRRREQVAESLWGLGEIPDEEYEAQIGALREERLAIYAVVDEDDDMLSMGARGEDGDESEDLVSGGESVSTKPKSNAEGKGKMKEEGKEEEGSSARGEKRKRAVSFAKVTGKVSIIVKLMWPVADSIFASVELAPSLNLLSSAF
jgi:hypothetical protein